MACDEKDVSTQHHEAWCKTISALLKKRIGCACQGEYRLEPLSAAERCRLLERRLDRNESNGAIRPGVMMRLLQRYEVTVHARASELAQLHQRIGALAAAYERRVEAQDQAFITTASPMVEEASRASSEAYGRVVDDLRSLTPKVAPHD
ncbi:hypothetical protein LCGC14_1468350 [marine sediment metagenome]|uniref:Uncharacterized protein n=1 Tax=marine sediment metagenome TaxID=412755 RepID=A0A0F9MEX6_9ZZZZ